METISLISLTSMHRKQAMYFYPRKHNKQQLKKNLKKNPNRKLHKKLNNQFPSNNLQLPKNKPQPLNNKPLLPNNKLQHSTISLDQHTNQSISPEIKNSQSKKNQILQLLKKNKPLHPLKHLKHLKKNLYLNQPHQNKQNPMIPQNRKLKTKVSPYQKHPSRPQNKKKAL